MDKRGGIPDGMTANTYIPCYYIVFEVVGTSSMLLLTCWRLLRRSTIGVSVGGS